jgi:RNA polymerase sigma-70 factor (ECF subfamily)
MARPVDATLPISAQQLGELFDRHAAALALYGAQWTSQPDDCVQEALIELARQPAAPENPASWLYRVVRNRALNAGRAARRRSAHEQEAAARGESRSVSSAMNAELKDALSMLEPAAREIVVLRVWGQLAWQEIADVVGGSKSSAQRHYVQALERLRTLWEPRSSESKPCPMN